MTRQSCAVKILSSGSESVKKQKRARQRVRLTAVEIRQLKQAVDILKGKHGETAKALLQEVMASKGEKVTEAVRRVIAALTGENVDDYGSPERGHALDVPALIV